MYLTYCRTKIISRFSGARFPRPILVRVRPAGARRTWAKAVRSDPKRLAGSRGGDSILNPRSRARRRAVSVARTMKNMRRRAERSSCARLDFDSARRRTTKMIENSGKSLFIGERSDSRSIRFDSQIASSGETKEIAFDGRYRQKRLLVTSARDIRVRSTVFRRRFDGGGSNCRQQQSRASADHPHLEELRRGTLTGRMGVRPSPASKESYNGETEESSEKEGQEETPLVRRSSLLKLSASRGKLRDRRPG